MSDHIKITPATGTWVVRAGGAVLGESNKALELREGNLDPVIYIPRDHVAMALLEPSARTSHCPYRGDARYYSIQTKSELIADAAWSYETPKQGMEPIARHLAFDPEKVTLEDI